MKNIYIYLIGFMLLFAFVQCVEAEDITVTPNKKLGGVDIGGRGTGVNIHFTTAPYQGGYNRISGNTEIEK
jgi:hypothetical protein